MILRRFSASFWHGGRPPSGGHPPKGRVPQVRCQRVVREILSCPARDPVSGKSPRLRVWKTQSLRLPADADALSAPCRRFARLEIRWVDPKPSKVSAGVTAVRWAAGEGTAYAGVRKSVCIRSDGQPVASLFHPPPSEPDLQAFQVSGSPVDLVDGLRRFPCRFPGMDRDVAFNDEQRRFSVPHVAYLHKLLSGPPVPLRHVTGFPGRGLLRGLRRHRARAPEAILSFLIIVRTSMG